MRWLDACRLVTEMACLGSLEQAVDAVLASHVISRESFGAVQHIPLESEYNQAMRVLGRRLYSQAATRAASLGADGRDLDVSVLLRMEPVSEHPIGYEAGGGVRYVAM